MLELEDLAREFAELVFGLTRLVKVLLDLTAQRVAGLALFEELVGDVHGVSTAASVRPTLAASSSSLILSLT